MIVPFGKTQNQHHREVFEKIKLEEFDRLRVDLDMAMVAAGDVIFFIKDDVLINCTDLVNGELEEDYVGMYPYWHFLRKYIREQAEDTSLPINHETIEDGDILVSVLAYKKQIEDSSTNGKHVFIGRWYTQYLYKANDNTCHYVEPVLSADALPGSVDFTWI